jgi:polyisoprenyl-phosphate glycosyltransferase
MSAPAELFVSVVATIQDAAGRLPAQIDQLVRVLAERFVNYEVILVDDGSSDSTPTTMNRLLRRHAGLRSIRLARRYGRDAAATAGLECAIGDFVIVLDLDRDPIEAIPELVARARSGYDIIIGIGAPPRFRTKWHGRLAALVHRFFGYDPSIEAATMLAFTRPVATAVARSMRRRRNLALVAAALGCPTATIDLGGNIVVTAPKSLREYLSNCLSALVLHSPRPLRIVSVCGLAAGLLNVVYVGYILAVILIKRQVVEGWTTLSLQISAMFFLVFVILAVLAEYTGRTLQESQGEPIYHALEIKDSPQPIARPDRLNVVDSKAA